MMILNVCVIYMHRSLLKTTITISKHISLFRNNLTFFNSLGTNETSQTIISITQWPRYRLKVIK